MILFTIYILVILSGMIHETLVIRDKNTILINHTFYTIGTLVFLFVSESYILSGAIGCLYLVSIVKDSMEKSSEISYLKNVIHFSELKDDDSIREEENKHQERKRKINKRDAIICFIILSAMLFHAFVNTLIN
jgi:hypothetical protein